MLSMTNEDFIFEEYRFIRQDLKRIVNEEEDIDNIKFWGNDIIERTKFMCHLKKKVIKKKLEEEKMKERFNKNEKS